MMRLRASLCVLLLACIPAAWADSVNVTTVVDEDNVAIPGSANTGCSLREALHYMELSAQDRLNGYGGCSASSGASSTDTIVLPAANTLNANVSAYQLTLGEIVVRASVDIDGTPSTLVTNSSGAVVGADTSNAQNIAVYPVIQAAPGSRIFTVTHFPAQTPVSTPTSTSPVTSTATATNLTLTDLKLVGCGSACALNGGIIDVEDELTLTTVKLSGGVASQAGGALYIGPTGVLVATGSDFESNTAGHGAGIDVAPNNQSNLNSINITASSFSSNTATVSGGAVVEIQASQVGSSGLTTTTISGNTGTGVRARPGMGFKNDTIVNNSTGGVDWQFTDLSLTSVSMYNTLVAGNPLSATTSSTARDCLNTNASLVANTTVTTFTYNVFGPASGCSVFLTAGNGLNNTSISNTGSQTLVADDGNGNCLPAGQPGLLCPLTNNSGASLTSYHVPRLPVTNQDSGTTAVPPALAWLLSDEALNILVNKGSPATSGNAECASDDQRSAAQRTNSCDVGAIALQAPVSINQVFTTPLGETLSDAFLPALGDIQLLPGFACAQVTLANQTASTQDGCYKVLTAPAKGTFSVDPNTHNLVYTPGSQFYGTDTFSFLMATTLSRFSDSSSDPQTGQFVQVNVTIETTPLVTAHSSEAQAGSWSGLELLGLGGLFAVRARRQRRHA